MDNIYLLSWILCSLVLLPVVFLCIRCSVKTKSTNLAIVFFYNSYSVSEKDVQKIKELWWEEHFCSASDAKAIIVIAQYLSCSEFEKLKCLIPEIVVIRPWQLSEYIRTNTDERRKTL